MKTIIPLAFGMIVRPANIVVLALACTVPLRAADVTSTWNTGTGNWGVNSNWTNAPALGGFPNNGSGGVSTYDAMINAIGSPYTVTLNLNITVEDLALNSANATLNHTSGIFSATGAATISSGTYQLSGGTISNTTINLTGGNFAFTSSGGILSNGALLNGDLNLSSTSAYVRLLSGAGFSGMANLSGTSTKLVIEDTRTLTGKTINLDGSNAVLGIDGTNTLTLGAGTLVRGRGQVGQAQFVGGTNALINQGTIRADLTGQTLTIGGNSFSSQAGGQVEATNGGILNFVTLNNPGIINTSGGGVVTLSGTWNNPGNYIFSGTGSLTLSGGTISGGQITPGGSGQTLLFTSSGGFLSNGALLNGDLNLSSTSATVRLLSGASFGGMANLSGGNTRLVIEDTRTLTGKTINLDGSNAVLGIDGTNTLTLGAGTLVRGRGQVGQAQFVGGTNALINQGTIRADLTGQTLTIGGNSFSSQAGGQVEATNGGILNFVTLNNPGIINTSGGGVVGLSGTWNNPGNYTFSGTGSLSLLGGTVSGGQLTPGGSGQTLLFTSSGGFLSNGALLNGDLNLSSTSAYVRLLSGAGFSGMANLSGTSTKLVIEDTRTLTGKTINLDGSNAVLGIDGTNTLTLGAGTLVRGRGQVGQAQFVGGTNALINQGTIRADLTGQTLTIGGNSFSSQAGGQVEATKGGILSITTATQYTGTSLTAGIWKAFANSVLNLPTTGTGIITNQADITVSGTGSVFRAGPASATLESTLTTNSGALRILAGRSYTAPGAISNSGVMQLGGGTFAAPGLTSAATAELFGFGSVTPRPANSGLIRSSGGTLAFANGILGSSGTVQIDAGSGLNLSGGSSGSSAEFLIQNGNTSGSLNLGANSFTASVDYTNASFGAGNSFNPRANVIGTGQILASGGTGQTLSGSVTNGGTATPGMAFGNVHVGSTNTLNYQINNTGASGSRLRGAVQTTVNGGNLTDPKLSGSGVTAGNFGPLDPGASTGSLAVVFTPNTGGTLSGQTVRLLNNFDNVGEQTLSITGTAYRLALAGAPTPVAFGNRHVGDPAPSQALTITNIAASDGFSETLNASFGGADGGVTTNGGSLTLLGPGASNTGALAVGISTSSAGSKNGTATVNLASDGTGTSGLGTTPLSAQTVSVTGSVYRLAQGVLPAGTVIDFGIVHVAETAQRQVTVNNAAPADGFSESLDGNFSGMTGEVTAAGSVSGLAAGASSNVTTVTLDTATAGTKSGAATLALASNGTGTSNLASTALPSQVLTATGQVNHLAAAQFIYDSGAATLTGSGTAYTLNFGLRTLGEAFPQVQLRLRNAAAAPADTLAGSFTTNAPDFVLSGFNTINGIAAGQDSTPMIVSLQTDVLGEFSQTITLDPRSQNGSGFDGPLPPVTITLQGIVAVPPTLRITPSGANVILSWPIAEQSWSVKRSPNLQSWTAVTQPMIDTDLEHTVTVPRGTDPKVFFRLEK